MFLQMVQVNNFEAEELVTKEFGMHVHKELALIDARVLNPPAVLVCQYVIFSRKVILSVL